MHAINNEDVTSEDDEDDFHFKPRQLCTAFVNRRRSPVEHDENHDTRNHQPTQQTSIPRNINHVHVSEAEAELHAQSFLNPVSSLTLIPDLVQVSQHYFLLLSKSLGLVSCNYNEVAWVFSKYWSEVKEDKKKKIVNTMEVFSEGFIVCQALHLDDSLQYFHPKHYQRLTDINFQPNLTSTESVKAVGMGQFGKVYQAVDIRTKQRFAEKIIAIEQFSKNELDVLSTVNHKHIIKFFGAVRTPSGIHIFMEYADGGSVQQLLQSGKGLIGVGPTDEHLFCEQWAITYYKQILSALVYLHSEQIVHCDIKPSNVVLSYNKRKCFLTDFGEVRKIHNNGYVKLESLVGTQNYCSPEVIEHMRYYYGGDVWSAACFLLHMLTGHVPWTLSCPNIDVFLFVIPQKPYKILAEIPSWTHSLTESILKSSFCGVSERKKASELLLLAERNFELLMKSRCTSQDVSESFDPTDGTSQASVSEVPSNASEYESKSNLEASSLQLLEINGAIELVNSGKCEEAYEYSSSVSPKSASLQGSSRKPSICNSQSNEDLITATLAASLYRQIDASPQKEEISANGESSDIDDHTLQQVIDRINDVVVDDDNYADDEEIDKKLEYFYEKYATTSLSDHSEPRSPDATPNGDFTLWNGPSEVSRVIVSMLPELNTTSLRQAMTSRDGESDDENPDILNHRPSHHR